MIFQMEGKEYYGYSAISIVRALASNSTDFRSSTGTLREFLLWSLFNLRDRVPLRELDLGDHLSDETLAFSYLCMLDEYHIGILSSVDGQIQARDSCKELEG
jgi:hypothetical protein